MPGNSQQTFVSLWGWETDRIPMNILCIVISCCIQSCIRIMANYGSSVLWIVASQALRNFIRFPPIRALFASHESYYLEPFHYFALSGRYRLSWIKLCSFFSEQRANHHDPVAVVVQYPQLNQGQGHQSVHQDIRSLLKTNQSKICKGNNSIPPLLLSFHCIGPYIHIDVIFNVPDVLLWKLVTSQGIFTSVLGFSTDVNQSDTGQA